MYRIIPSESMDKEQLTQHSEGLLTVVFGVISFFILPRTPQTTRYLSAEEKAAISAAHEADRQMQGAKEEEAFSWAGVASAFKAPQMWLMFLQFFCSGGMCFCFCPIWLRSRSVREWQD